MAVTAKARVLARLFGAAVATEEVDLFTDPTDDLLPEEARALPNAVSGRLLEFRAGRHCARSALARLGAPAAPLLRREDRAPAWPSGFVGSITHTRSAARGFCGAAVARASEVASVGLDAELEVPLERALFRRVLRASEEHWIDAMTDEDPGLLAKLVFSAKECTYKCQYLLSRAFLEFDDVEISLPPEGGTFRAELRRDAAPFEAGQIFEGRYLRQDGLILTGITLTERGS